MFMVCLVVCLWENFSCLRLKNAKFLCFLGMLDAIKEQPQLLCTVRTVKLKLSDLSSRGLGFVLVKPLTSGYPRLRDRIESGVSV